MREFWKKHKKKIIFGVGLVALGYGVCKMTNRSLANIPTKGNAKNALSDAASTAAKAISENRYGIDETIYADLAYQIEEAVTAEGLDEFFTEKDFNVVFAKSGDLNNGVYEVIKRVTIKVNDITGGFENE